MSKFFLSVLAGLGSMIGWGTSDFLAKISIKKVGQFRSLLWGQTIGFGFMLIAAFFIGAEFFITPDLLLILFVSSAMGTAGFFLLYRALDVGNASLVVPIASSYSIFAVLAAFLFLGQRVNNAQYIAIAVIILGVILTSLEFKKETKKVGVMKGVFEVILFAVVIGFSIPLDDYVLDKVNWVFAGIILRIFRVLSMFLILVVIRKDYTLLKFPKEGTVPLVLIGFFDIMGHMSYTAGLSVGDSIIVAPIASALAIVTVILSVIFLKEKLFLYQIFGIILAIGGVVSLSIL